MAQNNVCEEEEYEEGITFAKIGRFIKMGWLRALIYIAALVLVATAIALPIKTYYKSEPVAQTSIEFIYKGIEKGEAPDGAPFDSANIIAPSILAAAVEDAGLGEKIADISSFRQSVRVESVETAEYAALVAAAKDGNEEAINKLRDYTMYPTRFNIVISDPEGLGLSDEQAKLLLGKIVMQYYDNFKERYSVINMFDSEMYVLSRNEMLEFTDIYDTYTSSLTAIKTYLTTLAADGSDFTSHKNNTTFNQLLSELSLLNSNFDLFNATIIAKNIWRNTDTAKNSLEASKKNVTNSLKATKSYIASLQAQIEAIKNELKPGIEAPSGGQILINYPSYPAVYDTLNNRLEEATRQVLEFDKQLGNIDDRLEQINNSETIASAEDKAAAAQSIAALESDAAALVAKVNSTIEDYYDTTFISSSVRHVQQPIVTRRGSGLSLTIVVLVAAVVGLVAACIVTGVKLSRSKQAKAQAAKEAEEENTEENK